jgi:hypothetical protein
MSYISSIQTADLAFRPGLSSQQTRPNRPEPLLADPAANTGGLSTGLELVLLVTMLSGLSLVLSIIAAGAF